MIARVERDGRDADEVRRSNVRDHAAGTQPLVIAIDPTGLVHRQAVRLGLQSDRFTEIVTGIDDGQLVATSSLNDLTDGDIVAPQVDTRTALAR